MPGSRTTQGQTGTRAGAPVRVAFHNVNSVGTLGCISFAAQYMNIIFPLNSVTF